MYLTVVPAVMNIEPHPAQNESVRYGILKARRLAKALDLNENNTVPFILMAQHQSEDATALFQKGDAGKAQEARTLH